MIVPLAISAWLYLLAAAFIAMGWVMTFRMTPESKRPQILRWLYAWSAKGLLLPLVIWALMNFGISLTLQPFMPDIQAAQNNGRPWFPEWLRVTAMGLFVISSYWAAATLAWVLVNADRGLDPEPRKDLRALAFTCAAGLGIPALLMALIGGWPWLGLAAALILGPLAGYAPAIIQAKKLPPMYARAIARMKFGKYAEAEWEIIRELEKCEDDFDGWMMLAELYATRFNDIAEAERTVLEVCGQPQLSPSQFSVALHRLADWHLKIASDPVSAKRALQKIVDRFPGTHLARMALLRLNQLPATPDQYRHQQTPKPIPLPALSDELDRLNLPAPPAMDRKQAAQTADSCVELLKKDPNDVPVREELARTLAEHLEQPDLGLEQLRLLLNMPDQPDNKRAEWLSLTAAWNIRYRHDIEAGRRFLERVISEFPTSPQAFAARRRLVVLGQATPGEQRA
jgi:hypothetical protein